MYTHAGRHSNDEATLKFVWTQPAFDMPDEDEDGDGTSRRAFVGGAVAAVAGAGVVYGASTLQGGASPLGGSSAPADVRAVDRSVTVPIGDRREVTLDLADNPVMGSPDADVVVYYWTDYQCPFCQRFDQETLPKLVENFVVPGKAAFVFQQFPMFGDDSRVAARMEKCVWRQVRDSNPAAFWNWHTAIYEEQGDKNSGWASRENLLGYTESVSGVDADAVATCLDEHGDEVDALVEDDFGSGRQFGLQGTPGFVFRNPETGVLGRMMGAQPYDRFAGAIEKMRGSEQSG